MHLTLYLTSHNRLVAGSNPAGSTLYSEDDEKSNYLQGRHPVCQ